MPNPSIVLASLDDEKLKQSITNLVAHVKRATHTMLTDTNSTVDAMEKKLKSLGSLKINSGGTADGGASKRAKAQNADTEAIEKNIAARDKQIKKNQEAAMSFDNFSKAQQVAIRSANPSGIRNAEELQTMNIQLDLLRERLREARQQYSSFVALAAHATTTGDKGLFQYATDGVHRYEQEVRSLIPQIRTLQSGIQQMGDVIAPQGHTIQNYVNSLQKANPELAALNAQYKRGTSLLQDQSTSYASATQSAQRYTEEIRKQAQAIRESAEYKAGKNVFVTTPSGYDAVVNIKDKTSIEDKLTETYQKHIGQKSELDRLEQTDNNVAKERLGTEVAITNEISKRKKYSAPETQVGYDVTRDRLAQIIATRNNIQKNQVVNWDEQTSSIKTLSAALKQYQDAYSKMSAIERNSPFGKQMVADMQVLEMNIQSIRREMSRPIDFDFAKNLPANTLEEISYKTQMLRAYAQGINTETVSGQQELTKVMNIVESLGEKAKNLQKTTKQIQQEANSTKFDKISQMPTDSIKQVGQKIKEVRQYISELKSQPIVDEKNLRRAEALYDRLIKQSQKLNETKGTHSNVNNALNVRVKTLDEIAKKMQRLQAIRQNLDINKQKADIDRINAALGELKKQQDGVLQRNANMIKSNTALGRSWNYMKNRLAFYVTVGATTAFINDMVRVRSEYEMNEKALGTLLNSAERGTRIFNELSNMALVSPYTLIELSAAAKQLTAYDIAAKDVVDTTRRLADISAAVGVPVERLTYALGQVKAYGHLTSQDARQFLNAGVPLVKELANRFSELEGKMVSTADVYDRMKKHAISYNDVLAVLTSMTDEGGRFFDYQAKTAETLKVRLANLTLAYNNMLNEIGKEEGGVFTTGIKGLTTLFKYWREISRVIVTVIASIGAYKAVQYFVNKQIITLSKSFLAFVGTINSGSTALAAFRSVLSSISLTGWVTGIVTILSYFWLFNNSADETKQKLQDIATAFEGIRKEATDLLADAISTDNLGTQLMKLKDMLELAETELGITIPINLEDVNESNVKQKLREAKNIIDNYVNFSQTFSEAAVDTRFNESMTDFGTTARSTYTSVTESINTVKVALQELVDAGKASKRDIEILKELDNKPKDGESRIEYFQRLVKLYEELGLIGKKEITIPFGDTELIDNMIALQSKQEASLDRLGIKNKAVFETMLSDVQDYYRKSNIAAYQFELQVERVAKSINLEDIPISERTAKLEVAINQEAAKNNWNEFAIQYAKLVANQKFGLNIAISEESKKDSEIELSDWQKRMQTWADKHGITFSLNFMEKEDEKTYADRMLQAAKDAQGKLDVQRRKLGVGTGSQAAVNAAEEEYKNARTRALQAGADVSSLDKKTTSSRRSAAKAESELAKILRDELSTIDKVRSIYKDLTKAGMSHANAVERATRGWDETVNAINRVLQKNGLQKLDLSKFAGIENPRELVNMLQSQLNTLIKRGAKPADIKELQAKIQTLNVDADKYDLTRITKGLNNELGKLKDEYELAVELDADPELGGMFLDMFGIDTTDFPKTIDEYMNRVQQEFDKMRKKRNFSKPLNIFKAGDKEWEEWGRQVGLVVDVLDENGNVIDKNTDALDKLTPKFKEAQGVAKKWAQDTIKATQDLEYKLADNNGKIAIEEEKLANLRQRLAQETNDKQRELLNLQIQDQQNAIAKLKEEILQMLPTYQRLFGAVAEHSAYMTRQLAKDYKKMLTDAQKRGANPDGTYTVIDPINKKSTSITKDRLGKEIKSVDKELRNTQGTVEKITEAFTKGEDGVVDWAHGIELVGGELQKMSELVGVVSEIASAFGNTDEYDETAEVLGDIGNTMAGLGQTAQGMAQIYSGDIIGGATNVVKGLWTSISTWFDNSDKRIQQSIKDSERAVKRLELAYVDLQHAVDRAYGTAVIGAEQATLANKKLQLAELQRQIQLEKSRDSKNRDEDKIIDLQKQYRELFYEIQDGYKDIVDDLMGTDVASFAENLVSSMIDAFKQGEDYMKVFGDKFDEMIDNMIMKSIVSRVVAQYLDNIWESIDSRINERSRNEAEEYAKAQQEAARRANMSDAEILNEIGGFGVFASDENFKRLADEYRKAAMDEEKAAKERLDAATMFTDSDIDYVMSRISEVTPELGEKLKAILGQYYTFGETSDKQLSGLQQGIQGITEDTAGALEAYMNGVSQQVYLHSDLLTQIRDAVVGFDMDVQLGVFSQMLLQLQNNYIVMQSMQSMMEGWTTPSGQGIRVELLS